VHHDIELKQTADKKVWDPNSSWRTLKKPFGFILTRTVFSCFAVSVNDILHLFVAKQDMLLIPDWIDELALMT